MIAIIINSNELLIQKLVSISCRCINRWKSMRCNNWWKDSRKNEKKKNEKQ